MKWTNFKNWKQFSWNELLIIGLGFFFIGYLLFRIYVWLIA